MHFLTLFHYYITAANSTCGVAPTLEVSKSALQGLTLHQLQFFNSSCNVADFANETANSYIISVNPNLCGAVVVSVNVIVLAKFL